MGIDYSKFESYEDFLNFAKKLDSDKQRITLIGDYFINNVEYNYELLEVLRNPDFSKEGLEKVTEGKYQSEDTRKRVINNILEKINIFSGDSSDKASLTTYLQGELNPVIVENGLIKKGTCGDYSEFIAKYCADLGIPCERIFGKGNVSHSWNVIYIDGKELHVDVTNAIFLRDKYGDNPLQAKPQDWIMTSRKNMFAMQPKRCIEAITDLSGEYYQIEKITQENFENANLHQRFKPKVGIKIRKDKTDNIEL